MQSSPFKPSRGIQYSDVALAADALLQEGVRPTIERIRLRIGRGSPNTVGPLLEQWFSSLGARIYPGSYASDTQESIPREVREAMETLWSVAQSQAQQLAESALQAREAALEMDRQALKAETEALEQTRMRMQERAAWLEQALAQADVQLKESHAQQQQLQAVLAERGREIQALTQSMAQSQAAHGQLQALFHQAQADHQAAMREAESRHTGNERRWLAEIDRARQEARKAEQTLQAQTQDFAKAQQAWTDRLKDVEQALQTADARVLSLEEQLAQAQAMVASQRKTLDEQAAVLAARSVTDSAHKTAMKTTWTRSSISSNALASRLGRRGTSAKKR